MTEGKELAELCTAKAASDELAATLEGKLEEEATPTNVNSQSMLVCSRERLARTQGIWTFQS